MFVNFANTRWLVIRIKYLKYRVLRYLICHVADRIHQLSINCLGYQNTTGAQLFILAQILLGGAVPE